MTTTDVFFIVALCMAVFNAGIVLGAWYASRKRDDDDAQH